MSVTSEDRAVIGTSASQCAGDHARSGAVDKSGQRVRRMFGAIAGRYDLLNHLLSLNIDRSWRTFTTRTVAPRAGVPILDCCTGTADLALAYDRAGRGQSPVVGTDFCREMLVLGHGKVSTAHASARVALVEGDTQRLPLPSNMFGIVSVAFGLRNVSDTRRGIDEMIRVARPGGKIAILEFSRPRGASWGRFTWRFFAIYSRRSARRSPLIMMTPTTTCHVAFSSFLTDRPWSTCLPPADLPSSSNTD